MGTPSKTVTPCSRMSSSALLPSKRGIRTSVAAPRKPAFIAQVWPKVWNSGSRITSAVRRLMTSDAVRWAFIVRLKWTSRRP